MAALTLANMLTRLKYLVPTTTMDTELTTCLLERMNYLVSLDTFPFQEGYVSDTLAADAYYIVTPDNFANPKSMVIYSDLHTQTLTYLDPHAFDQMFPNLADITESTPVYYTVKVAEGYFMFNCPADEAYTVQCHFYKIPDDVTDTTISQMTELAKLTVIRWAAADGFRMMGEHDRATAEEAQGNNFLAALKRRYQLSQETDARFISIKEVNQINRGIR